MNLHLFPWLLLAGLVICAALMMIWVIYDADRYCQRLDPQRWREIDHLENCSVDLLIVPPTLWASLMPVLAKPVLSLVCLIRQLRTRKPTDSNANLLSLYVMVTFDSLNLSDHDIDQLSKELRWKVIDTAEQRIQANLELKRTLESNQVTDLSLTDEIIRLKSLKFRVWMSLFPKFKDAVRTAIETPAHA